MIYNPITTVKKVGQETAAVTVASALIIQYVLEGLLGVEIAKEDIVKVSGSIGVVAGAVRGVFNWIKNRRRKI